MPGDAFACMHVYLNQLVRIMILCAADAIDITVEFGVKLFVNTWHLNNVSCNLACFNRLRC